MVMWSTLAWTTDSGPVHPHGVSLYGDVMSDSQRRRLVFGIIAAIVGGTLMSIGLFSAAASPNGAAAAPVVIAFLFLALAVYLLIRFAQQRSR